MSLHVGSAEQTNYLEHWLTSRAVEAPVLLVGLSVVALHEAVLHVAQVGLCQTGVVCGQCMACKQVAAGIHPDFIRVGNEDNVSIKALRGLLDTLTRKAQSGRRMVIFEAAERLSIPAVNVLLKTLEEPAADTRFILTTLYPGRLPATLRSRCQVVRISNYLSSPAPDQVEGGEDIHQIAWELGELLKKDGPNSSLRRAFLRLRDYYRIKSAKGNTKLARDVLRYSYEPGKRV